MNEIKKAIDKIPTNNTVKDDIYSRIINHQVKPLEPTPPKKTPVFRIITYSYAAVFALMFIGIYVFFVNPMLFDNVADSSSSMAYSEETTYDEAAPETAPEAATGEAAAPYEEGSITEEGETEAETEGGTITEDSTAIPAEFTDAKIYVYQNSKFTEYVLTDFPCDPYLLWNEMTDISEIYSDFELLGYSHDTQILRLHFDESLNEFLKTEDDDGFIKSLVLSFSSLFPNLEIEILSAEKPLIFNNQELSKEDLTSLINSEIEINEFVHHNHSN